VSVTNPDFIERAGESLAERVNPIVVKEVRQGLRTRVFWVFFSLMLLACLTIALIAFAVGGAGTSNLGQATFTAFFCCLGCVEFFVIPYSAYRSMAREREEETWVLLTLTGLGPRRILAGKIGSFSMQGVLYASAAAPFLLFSYYLNGIDLPTIVLAVLAAAALQVFLTATAVSVATLATTRLVRGLLHFLLLGFLLWSLVTGVAAAVTLANQFTQGVTKDAFWVAAAASLFALVTWGLLFFELAAARLSLPTESYARGPRTVWMVQVLGGAGFLALGAHVAGEAELLGVGSMLVSVYVAISGTLALADVDGMAKNHRRSAGHWSLLRPGALRGLATQVLGLALAAGSLGVAFLLSDSSANDLGLPVMLAPALALLYPCLAQLVARWIPHAALHTPLVVRVAFLGLAAVACGVPPLVGQVLLREPREPVLNALNPIIALLNAAEHGTDTASLTLLAWGTALGVAAWAFVVLARLDREAVP
jgi:ABC-type transport system involved in multi-copper enzyme maturation permease subunit